MVLYGVPSASDLEFMLSSSDNVLLESLSSTSSTRSDAESAPPYFEGLLGRISIEYTHWFLQSGRELPPEWTMADLVRAVISDERIDIITDHYLDVMLNGQNSWLCGEVLQFLDLINYSV